MILCDELWALGKGASETMFKEKGFEQVFANHINRIHDELAKYGKRIIVAGDEPLKHPGVLSLLKKDIILLPWDYSPRESFVEILEPFAAHHFDMIVTPGVSCWRKIFPDFRVSKINIRNFTRGAVEYDAIGVLNSTWDDWGINFFSNNRYGIAYGADQGWHSENLRTDDFGIRFSASCYGEREGTVTGAIEQLNTLNTYSELQNMEATVFWNTLIPDYGIRANLSLDQKITNQDFHYKITREAL